MIAPLGSSYSGLSSLDSNTGNTQSVSDTSDDVAKREKAARQAELMRRLRDALATGDVQALKSLMPSLQGMQLPPDLLGEISNLLNNDAQGQGGQQTSNVSALEKKLLEKLLAQAKEAQAQTNGAQGTAGTQDQGTLMSGVLSLLNQTGSSADSSLGQSALGATPTATSVV